MNRKKDGNTTQCIHKNLTKKICNLLKMIVNNHNLWYNIFNKMNKG